MSNEFGNELLNHLIIPPKEHNLTDEQMQQLRPLLVVMAYAEQTFEEGFFGENVISIQQKRIQYGKNVIPINRKQTQSTINHSD